MFRDDAGHPAQAQRPAQEWWPSRIPSHMDFAIEYSPYGAKYTRLAHRADQALDELVQGAP